MIIPPPTLYLRAFAVAFAAGVISTISVQAYVRLAIRRSGSQVS